MLTDLKDSDLLAIAHNEWLQHPHTKTILANLHEKRLKYLAQAEDYANSPGTPNNLTHMQNLLIMARTLRIEIIEYAKLSESITRSSVRQ